jgi:hypothetical protein
VTAPLAVSRRRAAQLLGTRPETITELVRRDILAEVPWGEGRRIPLESIQELARTGWRLDGPAPRRRPPRRPARNEADAIRSIDIESLREQP